MAKKDVVISFRISSKLKNLVDKKISKSEYDNLTDLIRSFLIELTKSKPISIVTHEKEEISIHEILKSFKETLDATMDKIEEIQENQNEKLHMISTYVMNGQRTFPSESVESMEKHDIETEIIKIVSVKPMTSEQLGIIFEIPEYRILNFLNPLLKRKVIGMNETFEYKLVESKIDNDELDFEVMK